MDNHLICLNEMNSKKKNSLYNQYKKNIVDKYKEKIKKEIFDLINTNMEKIKQNINYSKTTIDNNNQLNTIDKENFINYDGESISIISNSISEINSVNEEKEESEESLKNIFKYENDNINKESNDNDITIQEKYLSRNLPIYDSNSTSNTYKKKRNNISINKINNKMNNASTGESGLGMIKKNENDLINFFWEINLSTDYAFKFIENGFDDLNILIEMNKTGNAISNKNLKDIGILKVGERAKILIRLEEKAGIFPYPLENYIIYSNISNNNSLYNFLEKCDCQKYINNFEINSYYNSELLFSQMISKEPINKEILSNDFNIKNEKDINNLMIGLEDGSKNYLRKLKYLNKNYNLGVNTTKHYSCDTCLIF